MEMRHAGFANVVSLFGKKAALSYPAIAQVDAYWEGLRAGRRMPERAEVDPRGLGTALEFAFLMEQVAPGVARIRISGMHLRDLLGMEVRGMPLTAFFAPDARDRISTALQRVVSVPEVADITLSSPGGLGKPALDARMYLAPLANSTHGTPRILGCLQSHGEIGRCPRRFTVDQVQMRRIVASARPEATPDPVPPAAPGFAEPAPSFDHGSITPRRGEKAPYLRLIKNDD